MSAEDHRYVEVRPFADNEVADALQRGLPEELSVVVIGVSMHHPDKDFATNLCVRLSKFDNSLVRGNSILGFGHLARRFGSLDEVTVRPIVESGLADNSSYVRGQAWAAADDLEHFLKWTFFDNGRVGH